MLLYIENPKVPSSKLSELINEFSKWARYMITIQNFVALLYTNNKLSEKEIQGTSPFMIRLKRIKYHGINLIKKVKDLYSEGI